MAQNRHIPQYQQQQIDSQTLGAISQYLNLLNPGQRFSYSERRQLPTRTQAMNLLAAGGIPTEPIEYELDGEMHKTFQVHPSVFRAKRDFQDDTLGMIQALVNAPTQLDVSPLNTLALNLSTNPKGVAVSNAEPVDTADQRLKQVIGLRKLADESRDEELKQRLDFIKTLTGIDPQSSTLSVGETQPSMGYGSQSNQDARFRDIVQRDIRKAQEFIRDQRQQLAAADAAIASGDINQIKSASANIARLLGEKGALSEGDVNRVVPRNIATDAAGLVAYITATPQQISPEYITALRNAVRVLTEGTHRRAQEKIRDIKMTYSPDPRYQRNREALEAPINQMAQELSTPPATAAGTTSEQRKAAIRAQIEEIKKRLGRK